MNTSTTLTRENRRADTTTVFGFWLYLMTDFIIFASLFAVYAVLRGNTFGGPGSQELFSMPFVLGETLVLLASSFTCGLALLAARTLRVRAALMWLGVTAVLGASFLAMELYEFRHLVLAGHDWTQSAFLSAFFTLVGTHGFHVFIGLVWILSLMVAIVRGGLVRDTLRKLFLLAVFWHFLDIIWIFIFTVVYLFGAL